MKNTLTKTLLFIAILFFLSACTLFDSTSNATSGKGKDWHCEADIVSEQWHCTEGAAKADPAVKKQQAQSARQDASKSPAQFIEVQQPDQAVAEQLPQSSVETVFDISANGYTVQLGAYLSQAVAERFADKIITADSDITADTRARLRIQNIIANGQFRFVIVYGHYQTRQQAQNSAERLKVLNPQLEYWVRTVESMR